MMLLLLMMLMMLMMLLERERQRERERPLVRQKAVHVTAGDAALLRTENIYAHLKSPDESRLTDPTGWLTTTPTNEHKRTHDSKGTRT